MTPPRLTSNSILDRGNSKYKLVYSIILPIDFLPSKYNICFDFSGLSSSVTAEFKEDDELLLSLTPPQTEVVKSIEVVAYNPRDPSTVYSPDDSQCSPQGGKGAPGQVECSQNLRMTERVDTIEFIVVVFMSQNESQPESILLRH